MKPRPEPVDINRLHEVAHETIRAAKFPMLATVENGLQPHVRPVSPVQVDPDFSVYIANLASYHKTEEIAANPAVELAYLAPNHDQVRISGKADIVTDANVIEGIWEKNPLLKQYLGTPDNPEFILYRICPEQIRFMREWSLEYHEVPRSPEEAAPSR
ncbi:MAG: pyridoxamine 5'-phosphate oxidase family protein [Verrucomicrobiales bacterium]|nr:pyridoxamine 5'-phosphate oxidase family protein [Verrucomicrobiales bacterium]